MPPRQVPLYPQPPKLALDDAAPRPLVEGCSRCSMRATARAPVRAESSGGEGPVLLVVGDQAQREDNDEGRPFVGVLGARLRSRLRRLWQGPVVLDLAVKCYPGRGKERQEVLDVHVGACRPHLAQTVRDAQPARILALGQTALYSILGRTIQPLTTRRGYAWLWNEGRPVPVFYVLSPVAGVRNRFLAQYHEEDVAWAATARVPPPLHAGMAAQVVATAEEARAAVADLSRGEGFAFDLEWAGFLWTSDLRLLNLAAAAVGRPAVWAWDEEALAASETWEPLRALLLDPDVPKGGSNVKSDTHALRCAKGIRPEGITFDTRLQRKLLEPDASGALADMAELVGMGGHKEEAETALQEICARIARFVAQDKARKATGQRGFGFADALDSALRLGFNIAPYAHEPRAVAYAFLEPELRTRYVCRDAVTTARLTSRFSHQLLRSPERQRVWDTVVLPAARAIQRVEEWGVPYDAGAGELFGQLMQKGMDAAYRQVQQYAAPGSELNPGSPQQLGEALFTRLGLEPTHRTATGQPSTAEEALVGMRDQHPLPALILEFRHYQKLAGYAEDWARCVRPDGRIHPSIHLDGARSGRTSCSDPNLQNIPRINSTLAPDEDDGRRARNCFRAPRGKVLVQLDYSQLELRIAALLAGDVVMADLFRSGVDFHLGTAKLICDVAWGITPEEVSSTHRTGAKAVNFGIAYGKSDASLADDLGISKERAGRIRQAIFGRFVRYAQWCRDAVASAKKHGGCWTYWEGERARWRPLWHIADEREEDSHAASTARNGAINTPIQGTASEFCVASIARLVRMVDEQRLDAEVVLPIHDSIMLVVPEQTWREQALLAREAMTSYPWCTNVVPLEVDVEVGDRWGSLTKVKDL